MPSPPTNPLPLLLAAGLVITLLNGCAAALVGGAAVVGASVLHDRRDTSSMAGDQWIELQALERIEGNSKLRPTSRVSVTSYNQIVLLTGQADSQEVSDAIAVAVGGIDGVRRVVNEVVVGPRESLMRESSDVVVTSRVKLALTSIGLPDFDPTRVKVVTEAGTVYLMGLLSVPEAEAATETARYVGGVKRVVKLFEIRDGAPPAAAAEVQEPQG